MRFRSIVPTALLLVSSAFVSARAAALLSDTDLPSSQFDVTDKTQVPGSTLAPGHYSIKMLDHLTDRMVLQISNDQGKTRSTFLALPNAQVGNGRMGAIPYQQGKNAALRGFAFDNGTSVEFVYPKAQAVAIARQNSTKVPAIDPPSEGMPADTAKLSKTDMTLVTLWLLSPTYVGTESKPSGVLAQRYQAPTPAQTTQPQPELASNTQPAPTPAYRSATPAPAPRPVQMAQNTPLRKPVMARLPKTGSAMPLVWLFGGLSLLGALTLRLRKAIAAPMGA